MEMWEGSAAICVMDGKILMVKQGKPEEDKKWAVPAGGKENNENDEECCIREVFEETGYVVKINKHLHEKTGVTYGMKVRVQYFEVEMVGGEPTIQDPDGLIYEIDWKSAKELETLDLGFPEDRQCLIKYVEKRTNVI